MARSRRYVRFVLVVGSLGVTGTNGAGVAVATSWGPPEITYAKSVRLFTNGAKAIVSLRGIEEIIGPPTHCGNCYRALVAGACPDGHDPWDL